MTVIGDGQQSTEYTKVTYEKIIFKQSNVIFLDNKFKLNKNTTGGLVKGKIADSISKLSGIHFEISKIFKTKAEMESFYFL